MSAVETIEVPVTRSARVAPVGRIRVFFATAIRLDGDASKLVGKGDYIVVRPTPYAGHRFRAGLARVTDVIGHLVVVDITSIPAATSGDYVYVVEPERFR